MPVLTDLAAGHEFEPFSITIAPDHIRAYREAAADRLPLYESESVAPPLAVAALALGVLLEAVQLPGGSLHINESLRFQRAVPLGATVECRASLAQRSQRAGFVVAVIESRITLDGEPALVARATVMSPAQDQAAT